MNQDSQLIARACSSFGDIDQQAWDACACADGYNPFITYNFLSSLEDSGSATLDTGWLGQHMLFEQDGTLVGAIPCYLKNHSYGEYVFDHGWADALERAGGDYYPKLQVSVPFTPATGRRLLTSKTADRAKLLPLMSATLGELCSQTRASSVHITFLADDEWLTTGETGYLKRIDQQFHWQNDSYHTFDDFLSALSSRKRKAIRKERRTALENGISVELLTGTELKEEHWDAFFGFYIDTGSRKWGSPYLTRTFFSLIGERMADDILLIMAKRDGRYIAGALNFIGSETLFGRNWGCIEDHPCLHFELCYYQAIEWAIANRRTFVEAGAQGAHKLARGYQPVQTRSAHWIANPSLRRAVDDYLDRERFHVEQEQKILARHTPFRKDTI
ncbi:GNAT family N-acetyltransferase [Coralliovum pocilloporae]|uniref:GNAT family N-acetyltransferase n=1 Tax=Coralliovum pocilloporae TaxID=3066369 RepID=UPI0033072357